MNAVLKGYLQLTRPANLPTAAADVLAGVTIAGLFKPEVYTQGLPMEMIAKLLGLMLATVCLYAGGVVFNDYFDRKLDAVERPERPIPSKIVPEHRAALFGAVLFLIGLTAAFAVHILCGLLAGALIFCILLYNAIAKHYIVFGPLNMGLCRGLNLLLGMAVFARLEYWQLAIIPMVYIAAITLISQGEVRGSNRRNIGIAAFLYAGVVLAIGFFSFHKSFNFVQVIPFLMLFAVLLFKPLIKAYQQNTPSNIKGAVKAGVLSIIVLDASLAVVFGYWWVGLLILLLLPLSKLLAKQFAVT
jgi:4-hydroxybenzoate polyprenyltransferase